jgi:colanic acid/amylovoran biosynthesis glycosyltransferase
MKPRVAIFSTRLLSRSETFIRTQALALRRFEPVFVGLRHCSGLALPADRTIVLNEGGALGLLREQAFKATLSPPRRYVRTIEAAAPRLVHAHFATNAVFALPLARALGAPLLVTLHGYDVSVTDDHWNRSLSPWKRLYPARRRRLLDAGTRFVAVSEFIKRQAIARGFPPDLITVVHIGVDTEAIAVAPAPSSEPVVLFVGRLVEKKGCGYLLQAMSAVQRRLPHARTVVIGDGPLREALGQQARALRVNCEFLGAQSHDAVHAWLDRARVVCVPSVVARSGDAEGLPMIVYEAFAHARPVVAFRSAGIPEAVHDGHNGALVDEGDVDGLSERLTTLLMDSRIWEGLSRAARVDARDRFGLGSQTARLEHIYAELTGAGRSSRAALHAVAS